MARSSSLFFRRPSNSNTVTGFLMKIFERPQVKSALTLPQACNESNTVAEWTDIAVVYVLTFKISLTPSFGLPLQFGQVLLDNILYLRMEANIVSLFIDSYIIAHAHMYTYTRTHTHARTHARTHTHTDTHTHTHYGSSSSFTCLVPLCNPDDKRILPS